MVLAAGFGSSVGGNRVVLGVGSGFDRMQRIGHGPTAERREHLPDVGELGVDAVPSLGRGSKRTLGVALDPLSLGLGLGHHRLRLGPRVLELLRRLRRGLLLRVLGVDTGLLRPLLDGGQLLFGCGDLGGELLGRLVSTRGKGRLEVGRRGP